MKIKNERSSVGINYIFNVIQQMVTMLLPLVTTPYVSRILLVDGIGINSYTTANVTYFTLIGMLGISGYGRREVAICRDNRKKVSQLFWELEVLHLLFVLLTLVGYIALIISSRQYRIYYCIHLVSILASLIDINWFYQAYEKFKFLAIRNCVIKMAVAVLIFLCVKDSEDLYIYIFLQVLGTLIGNLSLWTLVKKYVDVVPVRSLKCFIHFKTVIVFFIPTIAASVYSLLDKSVINWITHSEAENGYYEQAMKIFSLANVFVQSLSTVSAARMSILLTQNEICEAKERMNQSLKFMLMLAMPCAWGIAGIANRFVPVFFGEGYEKVVVLLYILMPLVVMLGFSVYLDGMYLVPSGQRGRSAKAVCAGAGLNFISNIILVYFFGAIGATIATLLTESFVALLMMIMSRQIINGKVLIKEFTRYCLYGFILFIFVKNIGLFIENDLLCIAIQITGSVLIYGIILFVTRDEILGKLLTMIKKSGKYEG